MLRLRADAAAPGEQDQLVEEFADPLLELMRLLREATEVEHALLVQYLYAGFSVRPQYAAIVGTGFPASASNMLAVAVQEMQHLHAVNQLLVALGAAPNLVRQDFPYEPDIYPFAFNLEPLSRASVAKYVWTEAPAGDPFLEKLTVLGDLRPNHLGSLYATIIGLVERLTNDPPAPEIDLTGWPARLRAIKDEGEIAHFNFFREVYLGTHRGFGDAEDVWGQDEDDPAYPALDLPVNPTAFINRPGSIAAAVGETAAAVAWLSDLHYWIVLALLDIAYRHAVPQAAFLSKSHMTGPLHRLGKHLPTLGTGAPFDPLGVGYNLGTDRATSLALVRRLLNEAETETQRLRDELPTDYPFAQIPQTLSTLSAL